MRANKLTSQFYALVVCSAFIPCFAQAQVSAANAAKPVIDTGFQPGFLQDAPAASSVAPAASDAKAVTPNPPASIRLTPADPASPIETLDPTNPLLGNAEIPADSIPAGKPKPIDITYTSGLAEACNHVIYAEQGKPYDAQAYGLCFGYIRGVKNSYDMKLRFGEKGKICFPDRVSWIALINRFQQWAARSPGMQKSLAWVGVITAFGEGYPCRNKGSSLR